MGRSRSHPAVNFRALIAAAVVLAVLLAGGYAIHKYRKRTMVRQALASGLASFEAREYRKAAAQLGQYLGAEPGQVDVAFKYAEAQLRTRPQTGDNLKRALHTLENILRLQPGHTQAFEDLAQLYLLVDASMDTERVCRNRLQSIPGDALAGRLLASALIAQRKPDEAVAVLQPLIAAHPGEVEAATTLAFLLLTTREDAATAGRILDDLVANNPRSLGAHISRLRLRLATGQRERVDAELKEAETLDCQDSGLLIALGRLLSNLGMQTRANVQFDKAEKLSPTDASVYLARAQVCLDLEDFAGGSAVVDRALAAPLGDERYDMLHAATELYVAADRVADANKCIDQLRSAGASSESLMYLEAIVKLQQEGPYQAIPDLEDVIRRNPRHARAHLALARALVVLGQLRRAVDPFREYIRLDGQCLAARLQLASVLASLGQWAEAAGVAREAQANAPNHLPTALVRIEMEGQVAKPGGSRPDPAAMNRLHDQVQGLAKQLPQETRLRILLARLAGWQGRLDEADRIITQARTEFPEVRLPLTTALAGIYSEARQYDKAIADCGNVLGSLDASGARSLRLLIAELEARKGDLPKACSLMEQIAAQSEGTTRSSARLKLAAWLQQQNKEDQARACLAQAVSEDDTDIASRVMLLSMQPGPGGPTPQALVDQLKQIEGQASVNWRYWQARVWLDSKDWSQRRPEIESLLRECLAKNPGWADAALTLGALYEKIGNLEQAIGVYTQARAAGAGQVDVNRRLLVLMARQGRWSEVEQILDSLPTNDPVWHQYRVALAVRRGNTAKAIGMLESRLAGDTSDFLSRLQLAALLRRENAQDRADQLVAEAAKIAPNAPEVLAAAVDARLSRAQYQQALSLCSEAMAKSPGPEVYQLRARVHEAGGDSALAEQDLRSLAAMPGMAERAFLALGQMLLRQGKRDQGIQAWREGLGADSRSMALRLAIASALIDGSDEQQREAGKRMLEELLEERPEDESLRLVWADQLRATEPSKAESIYERILDTHPASPGALLRLVQIAAARGQRERALQLVERALGADSQNVNLLLLKSDLLLSASPNRAAIAARDAILADPENEAAAIALAKALAAAGDYGKAVEALEAFRSRPQGRKSSLSGLALAQLYLAAGRADQAQAAIDQAAKQEPDSPATVQARMYWLHARKQWDALSDLAEQYARNHPNETATQRLGASLLLDSGQTRCIEVATALLEQAARSRPDEPAVQGELGFVHYRAGRIAEARAAFERGLRLAPNDVGLINALAWLLSEDQGEVETAAAIAGKAVQGGLDDPSLLDTWGVIQYRQGHLEASRQALEQCLGHPQLRPSTKAAASFHLARTLLRTDSNAGLQMLRNLVADPSTKTNLPPRELEEARGLLRGSPGGPPPVSQPRS